MAISAGPLFRFNPSISFHVKCKTRDEVDALWEKFLPGDTALMELGAYPFSERYGWIQDQCGLSWQIVPTAMNEMMQTKDQGKLARVTEAFLKMKKFDVKKLEEVYSRG